MIEDFVEACRIFAAEALGVDQTRITAKGTPTDDGVVVDIFVDGERPTSEESDTINAYMDGLIAKQAN